MISDVRTNRVILGFSDRSALATHYPVPNNRKDIHTARPEP